MLWSTQRILVLAFLFSGVPLLIRFERDVQCGTTRAGSREASSLLESSSAKLSDGDVGTTGASSRMMTLRVAQNGERPGGCTAGNGDHPAVCVVGRWEVGAKLSRGMK